MSKLKTTNANLLGIMSAEYFGAEFASINSGIRRGRDRGGIGLASILRQPSCPGEPAEDSQRDRHRRHHHQQEPQAKSKYQLRQRHQRQGNCHRYHKPIGNHECEQVASPAHPKARDGAEVLVCVG